MPQVLRLPLLLGLLLTVTALWFNQLPSTERPAAAQNPLPRKDVDFYIVKAQTVQYNLDGSRHYILNAEHVQHLEKSDQTLLERPELRLYRDGQQTPWHIHSAKGEVQPGGEEIELIEQVRAERTNAKGEMLRLSTQRMTLQPKRRYAHTQQDVKIEVAGNVTTATGMKAYMDDGKVHLLSNVRGQHEAH